MREVVAGTVPGIFGIGVGFGGGLRLAWPQSGAEQRDSKRNAVDERLISILLGQSRSLKCNIRGSAASLRLTSCSVAVGLAVGVTITRYTE